MASAWYVSSSQRECLANVLTVNEQEQKLSDIAGCLADVLKCTAGDTSTTFQEGKQYLNILLQTLSSIRGKESRYLKPLMGKMEGLMGYGLHNQTLPLPADDPATDYLMPPGPRFSIDSLGMLRTLSMSGNLGMPALASPQPWEQRRLSERMMYDEQEQRRPSGRVYDEYETTAMGQWFMDGVVTTAA